MSKMPPIPPGNQSTKGPTLDAEAQRDTSKGDHGVENTAEQGDTANIKQNTTNAGFTSLEDGVTKYMQDYLLTADPFR